MEKLSENAENLRKLLSHYSAEGTTAKVLLQYGDMKRTAFYKASKELESKGYVAHEKRKWTIKEKQLEKEQPPKGLGFWAYRKWKKEYEDKQSDLDILKANAQVAMDAEELNLVEDKYKRSDTDKIRRKVYRDLGLNP